LLRHPIREARSRRGVFAELERLDPERDNHRMTQLVAGRVLSDPLFVNALMTVTIWRTVAIRGVAPILHQRGKMYETGKRVDDSLLFFGFFYRDGWRSERAGATIDRLAAIHEQFNTRPDDYLYVIALASFEPLRIGELLGVTALTEREARALFVFWCDLGRRWGIEGVPGSAAAPAGPEGQAEFRAWMEEYERTEFALTRYSPALATVLGDNFCKRFFPGPLKGLGYTFLRCLSTDDLLDALNQPHPPPAARKAVAVAVAAYLRARRIVPASADNRFLGPWTSLYGHEPTPEEIGPEWAKDITAASRKYAKAGHRTHAIAAAGTDAGEDEPVTAQRCPF